MAMRLTSSGQRPDPIATDRDRDSSSARRAKVRLAAQLPISLRRKTFSEIQHLRGSAEWKAEMPRSFAALTHGCAIPSPGLSKARSPIAVAPFPAKTPLIKRPVVVDRG